MKILDFDKLDQISPGTSSCGFERRMRNLFARPLLLSGLANCGRWKRNSHCFCSFHEDPMIADEPTKTVGSQIAPRSETVFPRTFAFQTNKRWRKKKTALTRLTACFFPCSQDIRNGTGLFSGYALRHMHDSCLFTWKGCCIRQVTRLGGFPKCLHLAFCYNQQQQHLRRRGICC